MRNFIKIIVALTLSSFSSAAIGQETSLDALLDIVRQGKVNETEEYRQREAEFRGAKDRQLSLIHI